MRLGFFLSVFIRVIRGSLAFSFRPEFSLTDQIVRLLLCVCCGECSVFGVRLSVGRRVNPAMASLTCSTRRENGDRCAGGEEKGDRAGGKAEGYGFDGVFFLPPEERVRLFLVGVLLFFVRVLLFLDVFCFVFRQEPRY